MMNKNIIKCLMNQEIISHYISCGYFYHIVRNIVIDIDKNILILFIKEYLLLDFVFS